MALHKVAPSILALCILMQADTRLSISAAQAQDDIRLTIVIGTVTDVAGSPLGGVVVEGVGGLALPALSLPNGFYFIGTINQAGDALVLRYTKDGYMRTLETVSLPEQAAQSVMLIQKNTVMKRAGEKQNVNLDSGGTASEETTKVTIEPGDLADSDGNTLTGTADVSLTPIDPSGDEIELFPGFGATQNSEDKLLESFSAVDVQITAGGGAAAAIASGKTLRVEFPIPDAQQDQFTDAQTLDNFLWALNENTGIWEEGLSVTVGPSTTDPTKLAFFGEVPHLSTWNCDRPLQTTCLRGKVVEQESGRGISGAAVSAAGVDYNGQSSAITDADGNYCIEVKRDATVKLVANAYGLESLTLTVNSPNVVNNCVSGDCQAVDDLVIDLLGRTACISGVVYNDLGLPPIPPAIVFTDEFTWTETDVLGRFCLQTTPGTELRIVVVDPSLYLLSGELDTTEQTVTIPDADGRCGEDGGCVEITIGQPLSPEDCGSCGAGLPITGGGLITLFMATHWRRRRRFRRPVL